MRTLTDPRRSMRDAGSHKAGPILSSLVIAACLMPIPVEAATAGRTLQRAPEASSQTPPTCRPKWPYIVLTCVA